MWNHFDLEKFFLPYQRRWITDEGSMKLYAKSRRIGITYATSFRVNDKCLRRRNFTQWVTSRDELTAREFITDYVAMWAKASNAVCRGLSGNHVEVVDVEHGIRAYTVLYSTGSRVVSLSSTPEAFAGKGGDILIDEADLHRDSGKVIDMALPCTTWGGQLEVVSALRVDGGMETPFCRLCRDAESVENPMGWHFHRTSIADAVEEGFVEKINQVTGRSYTRESWLAEMRAKCRTLEAWESQYMIRPAEDSGSLLCYDLICGCQVPETVLNEETGTRDSRLLRFGGFDVARKHDLAVYCELELHGDVLWQSCLRVFQNAPFREQQDFLEERLKNPRLSRLCIDSTGIGMMLAEELSERWGVYRVEGILFSGPVKESLAMPLRAAFEERSLRIADDPVLRADLHKLRKSVTASGHLRFDADRQDGIGHADRFWALALAVHAAKGERHHGEYGAEIKNKSTPRRESRWVW